MLQSVYFDNGGGESYVAQAKGAMQESQPAQQKFYPLDLNDQDQLFYKTTKPCYGSSLNCCGYRICDIEPMVKETMIYLCELLHQEVEIPLKFYAYSNGKNQEQSLWVETTIDTGNMTFNRANEGSEMSSEKRIHQFFQKGFCRILRKFLESKLNWDVFTGSEADDGQENFFERVEEEFSSTAIGHIREAFRAL